MKKSEKIACAGTGGSLGLAAVAGACGVGCGVAAAPLAAILSTVGLASVAEFLPTMQIPLLAVAGMVGLYSLWILARAKNTIGFVLCGLMILAGGAGIAWQMMSASECETSRQVETVLKQLSPQARAVFQKGVYQLWPELGRAPTFDEVQERLGFPSPEPISAAFGELEKMGFHNIFFGNTKDIKWFWPFSSLNHGIEVALDGMKPVHARCAIDALGMSAMFGKAARISIQSAFDRQPISMEIIGDEIKSSSSEAVVSYSQDCDDMLFFTSRDEFDRYVHSTGKNYLKLYSLKEALRIGVRSFGRALKV